MSVGLTDTVSAKRSVFSTKIDTDVVILDPDSGKYFGSGEVGGRIWTLIQDPMPVQTLCDTLQSEFEVDMDTCTSDVLRFLNQLHDRDLIAIG